MEKIEYKGYTIEEETEPWARKYNMNFRFYRDEHIQHARTLEAAKADIDERTCNDPEYNESTED